MVTSSDRIGQRFGRLVVLETWRPVDKQNAKARCRCDCGVQKDFQLSNLITGRTRSCGCLYKEVRGQQSFKHGACHTPEYNSWATMRQRCLNEQNTSFRHYGSRKIGICERWNDFSAFLEDVGPKPSPSHSLDRIDPNGNYEPGNVRWATKKEQARNRRNVRVVEAFGERAPLPYFVERAVVSQQAVHQRLAKGWSVEAAISTPRPDRRYPQHWPRATG